MVQILLKDVMSIWPPSAGAGPIDSPIAQLADVISRATINHKGQQAFLILSLEQGPRVIATPIPDNYVAAIQRILHLLAGLTIEKAGQNEIITEQ